MPMTAPASARPAGTFSLLVTDEIDREGVDILRAVPGFEVDELPTMPRAELLDRIGRYDAFVGRSATQLPAEVLRRARRLRVIGRAGVGIDNIDMAEATALGIAVINAPAGNTVSVAELFFGSVISLVRHLHRADASMRAGRWDRSLLLGTEIRGRTLGIIGLGRIGGEISARARAFEMDVVAYDPYVTDDRFELLRVERAGTLDDLLARADIVTVHTPLTDETRGMLAARELKRLRPGAIVVNMARGGIIDEPALLATLESGTLRGAILDVYAKEPLAADHPLRSRDDVVLTPHLGASTAEGQRNVAVDVCESVRDALLSGELSRAINVAGVARSRWLALQPALLVARRSATIARSLLADRGARAVEQVTLRVGSDLADACSVLLSAAATGVLEGIAEGERLNLVNARQRAEARGILLAGSTAPGAESEHSITVTLRCGNATMVVGGAAAPGAGPRIHRIGDFTVDVAPRHTLLVLRNRDVPGVIGRVGTLLGDAGVNIAEYHQARMAQGGEALAAVSVDVPLDESLRQKLLALPDVYTATVVNFTNDEMTARARGDDRDEDQ